MIKQPLLQFISTQTDVTASRAIDGTVYHNTTTKPIFVQITIYFQVGELIYAYSDNQANPTTIVAYGQNAQAGAFAAEIVFWVLPGNYYKLTKTGLSIAQYWIEYS